MAHKTLATTGPSTTPLRLCVLFGVVYFVQGFAGPTDGLLTQPIRSLQHSWKLSPEEIATFAALTGVPWTIKPLFGLIIDFFPLWGLGQRGYLLLCSLATAILCGTLFRLGSTLQHSGWLLPLVCSVSTAVAMGDVAVDGMMVRLGQPLGMTGRLQSVQWTSIYAASAIVGVLGGELSERNLQSWSFAVVACLAGGSFLLILFWRLQQAVSRGSNGLPLTTTESSLAAAASDGAVPNLSANDAIAAPALTYSLGFTLAYLLLWNFNPFSTAILYAYMKEQLQFDERFIGLTTSLHALGALAASALYGFYCLKAPFGRLLQVSVAAGVITTIAYLGVSGKTSALVVSVISGAAYMTGTMIQLDLAARSCPPRVAATVFSFLMAACNLSIATSTYVGGRLTTLFSPYWHPTTVFQLLVVLGAATSALCWFLIGGIVRSRPLGLPSRGAGEYP